MTRWNPEPAIERVWPKLDVGDCWVWTRSVDTKGYAQVRGDHGKLVLVHRLVYEHLAGPIPEGLVLDHLCLVHRCCNPDHLEPVTNAENIRRAMIGTCRRGGHPLTRTPDGRQRICMTCDRERRRQKVRQT